MSVNDTIQEQANILNKQAANLKVLLVDGSLDSENERGVAYDRIGSVSEEIAKVASFLSGLQIGIAVGNGIARGSCVSE